MKIEFHKKFKKKSKKLKKNEGLKLRERLQLFEQNVYNPILNNHPLKGKYKGIYSINITGDLRAIYEFVGENSVYFIDINNHGNLYN
jgi:addiction module RelE/StbE family toxin